MCLWSFLRNVSIYPGLKIQFLDLKHVHWNTQAGIVVALLVLELNNADFNPTREAECSQMPLCRVVFLPSTIPPCSKHLQTPKFWCLGWGCKAKSRHRARLLIGQHRTPERGQSHHGSNTQQQMCPQKKRIIFKKPIWKILMPREGTASISLQPLSPAASNTPSRWHGLILATRECCTLGGRFGDREVVLTNRSQCFSQDSPRI